jgi:hypothetical protein
MNNTELEPQVLTELRDLCRDIKDSLQRIECALITSNHDDEAAARTAAKPKLELLAARSSGNGTVR